MDATDPTTDIIDFNSSKYEQKSSNIKSFNTNIKNKGNIGTDYKYRHEIVWINVVGFFVLHALGLLGWLYFLTGHVRWETFMWGVTVGYISSEGVTVGAHRLFTHKCYKAKPLLKAILIIMDTVAGQNSIFIWARDHRLHHRYSDTDGDPHNSKRGFFFSHMGWLMTKKHPYVIELGKNIDMTDLSNDWMVMWQKKYYWYLYVIFALVIPVWVPVYFFAEGLWYSLCVCYFSRYTTQLNGTWLVNSAAHLYGTRPYDQNLQPVESWFVSFVSLGEGWHNYHHTFPWDYKAAELSMHFNFSASLIRFLERIGLAYDLKSPTPEMVQKRIIRTGDGTHYMLGNDDARSEVTAVGLLHPLNPSFTSKSKAPETSVPSKGFPLFHEQDVLEFESTKKI